MAKAKKSFAQLAATSHAQRFQRKAVAVAEWDAEVYVRQLSGREYQQIADMTRKRDGQDWRIDDMANILAFAIEDEGGEHPTSDWLMEEPFVVLKRLTDEVLEINGMSAEAREEAEKNS